VCAPSRAAKLQGPQALLPDAFAEVVRQVDAIAQVLGRTLQPMLAV